MPHERWRGDSWRPPERDEPGLIAAGGLTVGNRPRWLRPVVRQVLASYRSAPVDRPSELAGFVGGLSVLADAVERSQRRSAPVRVRQIVTVPGRMGARRWPVPTGDDLPNVGETPAGPDGAGAVDRRCEGSPTTHTGRPVPPLPVHLDQPAECRAPAARSAHTAPPGDAPTAARGDPALGSRAPGRARIRSRPERPHPRQRTCG